MPIAKEYPVYFIPTGLTDSIDQTNSFPGACRRLKDLIFDRTDKGGITVRPGVTVETSFPGINTPGVISAAVTIGSKVYGLIGSARNPGNDEPFVYDIAAQTFATVSGITAANTPTTQATTGSWTPPTMDMVGSRVIVTHPGFNAGGGFFIGWFDVSGANITSLTGNTHTNTLIDNLSANPITAGAAPGMAISGTNIQAGTTIVSLTASSITLSLATTGTTPGVALTITGGTVASPQWGAGNINGAITFTVKPVAVSQFFNRAYYAVANQTVFSDSLNGTNVTNATQALTMGNSDPVVALHGLPLGTTQSGILQALLAFKQSGSIWQITGDAALTAGVSQNELTDAATGIMPRTISSSPTGVAFMTSDGPRIIDQAGTFQWINKGDTPDLIVPFSACTRPSRAAACFENSVYRVCLDTVIEGNSVTNDYWFDYTRSRWNGPHSFPYHIAVEYNGNFYLGRNDLPGQLFKSAPVQSAASLFTDAGTSYSFDMLSASMPLTGRMNMQQVVESTVELNTGGSTATYNIFAYDDQGALLSSASITATTTAPQWGSVVWGNFTWTSAIKTAHTLRVPWDKPVVFKKLQMEIQGTAVQGVAMKNTYLKYQDAGYLVAA